MRDLLDCAVLYTKYFRDLSTRLVNMTDKVKRIQFNEFNMTEVIRQDLAPYEVNGYTLPNPLTLRDLGPLFHRYDVVIIPVNQNALIWLRVMLGNCENFPSPVVVLSDDVQPTALPDLAKLGVVDFININDSVDIFMARIKSAIERHTYYRKREIRAVNKLMDELDVQNRDLLFAKAAARAEMEMRPETLKTLEYTESPGSYTHLEFFDSSSTLNYEKGNTGQIANVETRRISFIPPFNPADFDDAALKPNFRRLPKRKIISAKIHTVTEPQSYDKNDTFKDAKDKIVSAFEKEFIINALISSKGNIAQAAKRSDKNRRSFWELMRKHEISAEQYRQ